MGHRKPPCGPLSGLRRRPYAPEVKSEPVPGAAETQHRAAPTGPEAVAAPMAAVPAQDHVAGLFAAGKQPAGGRLPPAGQQLALLALQRSAGNQAVSHLVRPITPHWQIISVYAVCKCSLQLFVRYAP